MRLGFDATSLTANGKGLARFQGEFLRELARLELVPDLTVFVAPDADPARLPEVSGWYYRTVRTRPMLIWEQLGLPLAARREQVDVVVTTSDRAALWGPTRVMYIFEHPRHRAERDRLVSAPLRQRCVNLLTRALFPLALRRAGAVLVSSKATARDLARIRRPELVYAGVSPEFAQDDARAAAARTRLGADGGYVLHLASGDPRENSATVIEALAALAALGERLPLFVAGPVRAERAALEELARERGVADQIVWLGFVTEEELGDLYRGALAYVDPSLYEGFGLQALEAMACGTPAVTSNRTSLPEVVGDGGVLLDPYDVAGFAAALARIVREPAWREELSGRAVAHAGRFTWERTVRGTLAAAAAVSRA